MTMEEVKENLESRIASDEMIPVEHGIHRISAYCDPKNPNSWELLEKLGFTREGFLQKNVYFWKDGHDQPIWKDTYIYGLLNSKEN